MKINTWVIGVIALACMTSCASPIAKFTYEAPEKIAPSKVTFDNQSEKADRYEWDFGDGNTSSEELPTYRYLASGNYEVTLKAMKGKRSTTTKQNIVINAPEKCLVEIQTDYGNMLVELYDTTPKHRDNFVKLAENGFYDDLLFHRVIDGFMLQGGDPESKEAPANKALGSGGPGYQVDAEFSDDLVHTKGALAAARTGDATNPERKSSGSQFYIVQGRAVGADMLDAMERRMGIRYTEEQRAKYLENGGTPHLDRAYTVFGQVIKGLDIIDKISAAETSPRDRPLQDIKMKVRVIK